MSKEIDVIHIIDLIFEKEIALHVPLINLSKAYLLTNTPLGTPVEPDVNNI